MPNPANPQSLNRYSYVLNNPLAYIDPSGHDPDFPMIDGMCGSAEACAGLDPQVSVFDEWWDEYGLYMLRDDRNSPDLLAYAEAAYEFYSPRGIGGERWLRDYNSVSDPARAPFRTEAAWYYAHEVEETAWTPGINLVGGVAVLGTIEVGINVLGNLGTEWGSRYRAYRARKIVYRGLAAGEDPGVGLSARAPGAGNSPVSHIAGKRQSQWISTTKDPNVAFNKYGEHGVAAIDLSKVKNMTVDYSNGIPGMPGMLSNWARADSEVLILNSVPSEAIMWWVR